MYRYVVVSKRDGDNRTRKDLFTHHDRPIFDGPHVKHRVLNKSFIEDAYSSDHKLHALVAAPHMFTRK